jgi:glycosyltransferase involved in cell wall biosynthesis
MLSPLVSVIIPVHNTEDLLDRTFESVTGQTLREIEVICMDDGSTDGSLAVLQAWAQRDPRIRVIAFPKNQGVSAARNAGFAAAQAPYVYYLDSDDWIDDNYLEAMYDKAVKTGQEVVVNANYIQEFEDTSKNAPSGNFGFITGDGFYPPTLVQTLFPPVIWARLYKRDYLLSMGITFPDVKGGAEDIYYAGLAELLQPRSYVFRGPFQHYWQREGSLFHQKTNGFYYIQSFKLLYDELLRRGVPTEEIRLFYAGPMLLDSQDKFDFVRSFLLEIQPQVLRHKELYVAHDLFLLDAVCGSADYADFLSRHNPNIALAFIRSRMKTLRNNG